MATNVKPMPAGKFPLGHAKENKDASAYTGFKYPSGGGNDIGVYKQPMPNPTNAMADLNAKANRSSANTVNMSVGNVYRDPEAGATKTSGIQIRGVGAATKGTKARGPMA